MNGFANHKDARRAFAIPIAPIPTGSGNALSLNLLGFEVPSTSSSIPKAQCFDVSVVLTSPKRHST
jgi:hypothetical protein